MTEPSRRPAFYAARGGSRWRDWWNILHPPYTLWHLSYVVMGACLVAHPRLSPLFASLGAFFLAVGVAAHALDELHGRPLGTSIPAWMLISASSLALAGSVALGVIGITRVGPVLIPFIVVGAVLVVAYNFELFGGLVHNDIGFALGWGTFPLLTAYVAEAHTLRPPALLAGLGAFALSSAQRSLSTRARLIRRSALAVDGTVLMRSGEAEKVDAAFLLLPIERALRALSWSTVAFAAALALERLA